MGLSCLALALFAFLVLNFCFAVASTPLRVALRSVVSRLLYFFARGFSLCPCVPVPLGFLSGNKR